MDGVNYKGPTTSRTFVVPGYLYTVVRILSKYIALIGLHVRRILKFSKRGQFIDLVLYHVI